MEHYIIALAGIEPVLSFLRAIFYFVIAIFILVSIHEFGHFIAGRIFGMHVPVFSVGMGRRLFGWNRLNGFTGGPLDPAVELELGEHTDYRLSLLPLGGYAKIDGMIDETQTDALPTEIMPWEFRAKPWWQKSIVISAGVILNVLLAWFIFSARASIVGQDTYLTTTVSYVDANSLSRKAGLLPGDRIVSINNHLDSSWTDVTKDLMIQTLGTNVSMLVDRHGAPVTINYSAKDLGPADKPETRFAAFGITPTGFGPPTITNVSAAMPAQKAGLLAGDVIVRANGDSLVCAEALVDKIRGSKNNPIALDVLRDGKPMHFSLTPVLGQEGYYQIGIAPADPEYSGPQRHNSYSLLEAPAIGWKDLTSSVSLTLQMLGKVIQGKLPVSQALGGPVKIAQMASQSAASGWISFITFIGLLSMSLALLNIMPIPALDGGHLLIILIEAVIGHELSQGFKLGFQKVGVVFLLSLMILMVYNDIFK